MVLKSSIAVFMWKKSRYGETHDSLHEGLAQLFCIRQLIFWAEKV